MKKLSARSWISIITLVLVGVVLFFSRKELTHAWTVVGKINQGTLLLIVPVLLVGYYAGAEMIFSYLQEKGLLKGLGYFTKARMALELNFVNHVLPSGGLSGVSYMNWRLSKFDVPAGKGTMAQAVRYVAHFASLVVLLAISVILVTIDGQINRLIILMSSTLVTVLVFVTIGGMYMMSNRARMEQAAWWISRVCNKLVRKLTFGKVQQVIHPTVLVTFLNDMSDDYRSMMQNKRVLVRPFLWGMLFTICDIAVFWIVFWALGSPINPAPILIGYGLANLAAFAVVTPGGAGAYEAVMVFVLSIAGMPQGEAIAGIVLSRAIILAVTLIVGWFFYQHAVMKYGRRPDSNI